MHKALADASALTQSPTLRAWAAGLVAGSLALSACVSRAAAPAVVFPLDTESFDHLPVAATVQSHHPTSSVGIPISVVQMTSDSYLVSDYSNVYRVARSPTGYSVTALARPQVPAWGPAGLDFRDGTLWVANYRGRDVLQLQVVGDRLNLLRRITDPRLREPRNLRGEPDGSVVVADYGSSAVLKFDADGSFQWQVGVPQVHGLTESGGFVYASSLKSGTIIKIDDTGDVSGKAGSLGPAVGHYVWPVGLADLGDRIAVTDAVNGRITLLDHNLKVVGHAGGNGPGLDAFNYPFATLAVAGGYVVADSFKRRLVLTDRSWTIHDQIALGASVPVGRERPLVFGTGNRPTTYQMLPGVDVAAQLGLRRPLQFVGGYGGLDHVASTRVVSHLDLSSPEFGASNVAWAQNVGRYVVAGSPEGHLLEVMDPKTGMFTDVDVGGDAWWLAGWLVTSGNQRRDLRQVIEPAVAAFDRARRLLQEGVSRQDAFDEALAGGTTVDWSKDITTAAGQQFLHSRMTGADAARYFKWAMSQRRQRVVELLAVRYLSGSTPLTATPASVPAGVSSLNVSLASASFAPESPGARAIAASVGGGVVVNSVRYQDPTHVVVNLDTTRARAGTYDVTVTNPTGRKIKEARLLEVTPPTGELRVTTNPALTSEVLVDGTPRDSGAVNDLDLPAGSHQVSFTHEPGFTDPAPQTVALAAGAVTQVVGTFVRRGTIRVSTSPNVPAAISVDGIPRDDGSISTDLSAGLHRVCFGPTPGFTPPACQTVSVVAGGTASLTGRYTSSPGAPGPSGTGRLRVTTNPALSSQVLVNGVPMDSGGLEGVDLPPGTYTVAFTHVEGFTGPPAQAVTVSAGADTSVTGNFLERGSLTVVMSPEVPASVTVDDVPHDSWGMSTEFPAGMHTVCFGWAPRLVAPPCQTVTIAPGQDTTISGTYTPGP